MRLKTAVLAAVLVLASVSGLWLIISPSVERQIDLNRQNEMLTELDAVQPTDTAVSTMTTTATPSEPETTSPASFLPNTPSAPPTVTPATGTPSPTPPSTAPPAPQDPLAPIGTLVIDKINLKLPVVEGVTLAQLKVAVGHVPQTPAIGDIGNAVIAGHRNYAYGSMFNRLGEIATGDIITYTPKGGTAMTFKVFEVTEIVPGDPITFIQPTDESIITLYTCTPIRQATHRLLIRARLINQ